jgi:hypothetical protein
MTLDELTKETLSQKHRRLMQAKCCHPEVYSSTVLGTRPSGVFTNSVCLDCGKHWRSQESS